MPICPRCNSTIHSGAEEQCPACGYGMERADALFGVNDVEFTRVVDDAGALTHKERMELLRSLADMERHVPPVALCIYITDHGQLQEFRPHAHWILNHARIHHPSFGKREQMKAIEDAVLTERRPGEGRPQVEEEEPGRVVRMWRDFCNWCRDLCLPTPPPVRQDWILMLVVDVQLETACFSWGYMLDPYINVDKINSCILKARLQFREREMVTALRMVMFEAVTMLAKASRKVNRGLRQAQRRGMSVLPWLLAGTALMAGEGMAQEAPAAPEAAPAAVAPAAEAPAEAAPAQQPAPPPPPVKPGVAASYSADPQWSSVDYVHLMSGRLPDGFNQLMPGGKQRELRAPEPQRRRERPARRRRAAAAEPVGEESDVKVPGRYCKHYLDSRGEVVIDPQMLLSEPGRKDVSHVLRELNARSKFHIYVSVFLEGQEVPRELDATNLVTHTQVARPGQYAVMLQYSVGHPAGVELGYREIKPSDEQVREWLLSVRRSVNAAGGGVEGLLAGIYRLHSLIEPISSSFVPLTPEVDGVQLIELPLKQEEEVEEISYKKQVEMWVKAGGATPYVIALVVLAGIVSLFWWLIYWHLHCGRLFSSEPDCRLGSRYGAGVSRYVRYLEGKEAGKEKQLF